MTAESDADREQIKRLAPKLEKKNANVEEFANHSAVQITPAGDTVLAQVLRGIFQGLAK
jgi:hypothetical protein